MSGDHKLSGYAEPAPPPPDTTFPDPDVLVLAYEPAPMFLYALWKVGNHDLGTAPLRFSTTTIGSSGSINDHLADPYRSFDGDWVVYCRAGESATPKRQSIRVVDWGDSVNTEVYAETNSRNRSLQPSWSPDDSKILFRAKGAIGDGLGGFYLSEIKEMDPDGSNVATLYSGANDIFDPTYSWDGTRIAFVEGPVGVLKVMDADGSNLSTLRTPSGFYGVAPQVAWAYGSLTIAFYEGSGIYSQDAYWKVINDDGSGAATIHTISRGAGYGPSDQDPYPLPWTWLPDDSAIVTTLQTPSDPDPDHHLVFIDAGGGGVTVASPAADIPVGSPDYRPAILSIPERGTGAPRLFYHDGDGLRSREIDGSDDVLEGCVPHINGFPSFQGFRGDTVNI